MNKCFRNRFWGSDLRDEVIKRVEIKEQANLTPLHQQGLHEADDRLILAYLLLLMAEELEETRNELNYLNNIHDDN